MGGGERVAWMLAARQVCAGHRVTVLAFDAPTGGGLASAFADAGANVVVLPKSGGLDPTLAARVFTCCRTAAFDVVHTHNPLALIYAAPAARLAGAVVVHTKHGPQPDTARRLALRRAAARATRTFVAVSDATAHYAVSTGEASAGRVVVIQNGIDVSLFSPAPHLREAVRAHWGVAPSTCVIGTVGRLAPEKNHRLLLTAVRGLLGETRRLVIVGDGPERDRTRAHAAALGLTPFVHFVGECHDVAALLNGLDVFALSSDVEGMPLVILEAMSVGLPVVATAVGGVPNMVGNAARLVPRGDPESLGRVLAELGNDDETRMDLGRRARQKAILDHSDLRMAAEYEAAYLVQARDVRSVCCHDATPRDDCDPLPQRGAPHHGMRHRRGDPGLPA